MTYPVKLDVHLKSVWHTDPPVIVIGIDNNLKQITLSTDQTFHYEFDAIDRSTLTIALTNKTDADTMPDQGLDKAVIIESIGFFDITDPRFVWAGEYRPCYPEPWASEQSNLPKVLKNHNYLGWNGKWTLTFGVPVFTWIHQTQDLGWIYN
jgi:hypothetical protein